MLIQIPNGFLGAYGTLPPSVNKVWCSRRGSGGLPQHYKDPRCKTWEAAFRASFTTAPKNHLPGPWSIAFLWLVTDPRSDVDNRTKIVLDALEGILFPNDVAVDALVSRKARLNGGRRGGFLYLFGPSSLAGAQAEALSRFAMPPGADSSKLGWLGLCIDALRESWDSACPPSQGL
jgi:Holliday junction resolvase RusA-like endonuclease